MKDNSIIRSLFEPTIELDELKMTDAYYGTDGDEAGKRETEIQSVDFPIVVINDYRFKDRELVRFEIDCTEFIPKIYIEIYIAESSEFYSLSFPKDGDLISIFIRGRDDIFKPFRNDFLITNVDTDSDRSVPIDSRLFISGQLQVPHLYDEHSFAKQGTSFEVLKEIARELGLGFATNIENTADEMNWICANETYENFIQSIGDNMWSDANSFYTVFIDSYYHLNVINLNTQFDDDTESLLGMSDNMISEYMIDTEHKKTEIQKIFSNHPSFAQSMFYIVTMKPINKSSEISKNYGYVYNLNFFEHNSLKDWEFPVEALVTEGNEDSKIIMKGRPNEDFYKTQQKYNYTGIQYSYPEHNVHENYYLAKIHNMMNLAEIEKMNVEVTINKINFNFIRFEKVPMIYQVDGDQELGKKLNDELDDEFNANEYAEKIIVDPFYSGWYAIKGFKVEYTQNEVAAGSVMNSPLKQTFILTRREWPSATGE